MAGHSKWANIKHRKGRQDAKRAKFWTKILREVQVAAKLGGPDADSNPRLRVCLNDARSHNIPKDTIKRAVEKLFGKKVVDVRTCNFQGKQKRRRRADAGRTAHWKKAIVRLKEGESLELV